VRALRCCPTSKKWQQPLSLHRLRAGGNGDTNNRDDEGSGSGSLRQPQRRVVVDYDPADSSSDREQQGGPTTPRRVLVAMDCFCPYHGVYLANQVRRRFPRDVAVAYVLSDYLRAFLSATQPDDVEQWNAAKMPATKEEADEWKAAVLRRCCGGDADSTVAVGGVEFVGVYCESDSGLEDAERLRELLQVRCRDDPPVLDARRHKYRMNERVRTATSTETSSSPSPLPVVDQRLCDSLSSAKDFAKPYFDRGQRVIVKPYRGVATESVYLCSSDDQVEVAWSAIVSSNVFGSRERHDSVVVQEFLAGTEYAVDVVTRNGQHKVAAIWRYDKRPANGAAFCYFRTELVDQGTDPNAAAVVDYVKSCLTALGVRWGLSHDEVIVTDDGRGPVLVEINCRQHNMDFCPLVMACVGYNALDMTVDALLGDDDDWDTYPDLPTLRAAGCMVHLVNYQSGTLVQTHHIDTLSELPSVLNLEVYEDFSTPGSVIEPTRDIRTDAGWVQLVNEDRAELEKDYETIIQLMPSMFQVA